MSDLLVVESIEESGSSESEVFLKYPLGRTHPDNESFHCISVGVNGTPGDWLVTSVYMRVPQAGAGE